MIISTDIKYEVDIIKSDNIQVYYGTWIGDRYVANVSFKNFIDSKKIPFDILQHSPISRRNKALGGIEEGYSNLLEHFLDQQRLFMESQKETIYIDLETNTGSRKKSKKFNTSVQLTK